MTVGAIFAFMGLAALTAVDEDGGIQYLDVKFDNGTIEIGHRADEYQLVERAAPAPAVVHTVTHRWHAYEPGCGKLLAWAERNSEGMISHSLTSCDVLTRDQAAALRAILTAALEGGE